MQQDQQNLHQAIARLWEKHRARVSVSIDVLEGAAVGLLSSTLDRDRQRGAEAEAHKLAGSLGTFGYPDASRVARDIELLFGSELGEKNALKICELVVDLRRRVAVAPAPSPSPEPAVAALSAAAVYIATRDAERAGRLEVELGGRGLETVRLAHPRDLPADHGASLVFTLTREDRDEIFAWLGEATARPPSIALMTYESLPDRVDLARHGVLFVLAGHAAPRQVADAVDAALARSHRPHVLAVDDDEMVLTVVADLLGKQGMQVTPLGEPLRFWQALEETRPDFVVLDCDMPGLDGVALCRALRRDPRWAGLPVLFLTGRDDLASVEAFYEAGADDYVNKINLMSVLPRRVAQRMERLTLQRQLVHNDSLTGVLSAHYAQEALQQLLDLAATQDRRVTLALFDIDDLRAINAKHGAPAGDLVLRRVAQTLQAQFRSCDVVSRWGGDAFLVGMFGYDRTEALHRASTAGAAVRSETTPFGEHELRVTVSAGLAQFEVDGRDLASLVRVAESAWRLAFEAGGHRVRTPGDDVEGAVEWYDVVVVEDDDAIAELLVHALSTRGLRVLRLGDGQRALDRLSGDPAGVMTRLVLLDVNLPVLDGLSLLRQLQQRGVLERARVIMLTARSEEREVVQALELGAFDHVAKPFSLPILMQRVRRALA